jgi:hypothetical protein
MILPMNPVARLTDSCNPKYNLTNLSRLDDVN